MEHFDHSTAFEHGFIERYHLGTLSPTEEERFEAHFMDCAQCQEELEVQRSFTRGMKTLAAEEATRSAVRLSLLAWLSRRGAMTAFAALVVLVAAAGLVHLLRENTRLETRVAELAGGTTPALQVSEVPLVLLSVLRGEDDGPVVVTDPGGPWSLAVDAGADPRFVTYGITLLDAKDEVRLEREDLQPNALEVLQLTFPSGFLSPGDYRLLVRGVLPGGERVDLGSYPFRLTIR